LPRYAEIENGFIINLIVADESFINEHKPEAVECPDFVGVGDEYRDGEFIRVVISEPINYDTETL